MTDRPLLRSKMFWVGILYFAQGFPAGIFYEILPVHLRTAGVDLSDIGFLSLLGLAWTLKFLWAPAVGHYRHYRRWMFVMDAAMAVVMGAFAWQSGLDGWVWIAVGCFTLLSATNDIAIDAYTIEFLDKRELGIANGLRIGFYRVGLLAAGGLLILHPYIGWAGIYAGAAVLLVSAGAACLAAPVEKDYLAPSELSLREELRGLFANPFAFSAVILFLLGVLWLIERTARWSETWEPFWTVALSIAAGLMAVEVLLRRFAVRAGGAEVDPRRGPMFGALLDMLQRPYIVPVLLFILTFKLADTSMGFMVKPFWVDAGFAPEQIGLVSVNIGIALSIAGGLTGGWVTDRIGIFNGLWVLGLFQALSNLAYAYVAHVLPTGIEGLAPDAHAKAILYSASAFESFTQGLGTAAFLAFLMAIVNKRRSATEYALLSAVFILSRSVAGWAGGHGAEQMGYSDYFLLTFLLAFPAYLLLPWVKRMLAYAEAQQDWGQK
ncbi:MAG TPA: MFS transporter [Gammaproteobacteria bacterium]|nr:MFS transporter [Gammaproteobacteria bacterium]